jgi:ribonucleoside-triphosphate reductase
MREKINMTDHSLNYKVLSDIVIFSKYSKYEKKLGRRKVWEEIVDTNKEMHLSQRPEVADEIEQAYKYVYQRSVFPSMRSLQYAGLPILLNPVRMFNCSYITIDHQKSFSEALFLLLSGTGVGFSVREHHVAKLPNVHTPKSTRRFLISDSIEGWADALRALVNAFMIGKPLPIFDFRGVRPAGSPIKTSGGKAPGPEPLKRALAAIQAIFESVTPGEKLLDIECHDIMCHISNAVYAGGIREAAKISLFSIWSRMMLTSKSNFKVNIEAYEVLDGGDVKATVTLAQDDEFYTKLPGNKDGRIHLYLTKQWDSEGIKMLDGEGKLPWFYIYPHRSRSNNSAAANRLTTTKEMYDEFWDFVKRSGSGEPGIYFCNNDEDGTNPCVETLLKPNTFCNLSTQNVADVRTQAELNARCEAATVIGTVQASYTDYHYLRPIWKKNTEEDALLGVSMTGIANNPYFDSFDLKEAAEVCKATNERIAKKLGINPAARITCIKPEGTATLVAKTSGAGMHAAYYKYYWRRVRLQKHRDIYNFFVNEMPAFIEDDSMTDKKFIVKIPLKADDDAITADAETALQSLSRLKRLHDDWIVPGHRHGSNTHNVSATIYVKGDEWDEVGKWMWDNKNSFNGISILPYETNTYIQAPIESMTKEDYELYSEVLKEPDFAMLAESEDFVEVSQTIACAGGRC